jgi:hypothetical protein
MCGCLPPYASVVVRDAPEPTRDFVWHDGDMYTLKTAYNLQALAERLASPTISHVRIHRVNGGSVESRAVVLRGIDTNQPVICLDGATTIPLAEVDKITMFREIPKSKRHQGFLVGVTLGATVAVTAEAIDPGPWDWDTIAIATAAGAALGSISLLRHEEKAEQVLFSYTTSK